jgi:hypothetical protein
MRRAPLFALPALLVVLGCATASPVTPVSGVPGTYELRSSSPPEETRRGLLAFAREHGYELASIERHRDGRILTLAPAAGAAAGSTGMTITVRPSGSGRPILRISALEDGHGEVARDFAERLAVHLRVRQGRPVGTEVRMSGGRTGTF